MPVAPGDKDGLPFRGPSLWPRVIPFASVAVLAEASLILPPGPDSAGAVLASILLLLITAAAFRLPWSRPPEWAPAVVPLMHVGSVLALLLAAGSTSGVGIVILMPLIWTALFHRRADSACVVVAIVAAEIIVSLVPVAAPAGVILRRAIFWASLGALISVATHGLRDSIARSQVRTAQLQSRLRELTVLADRDRIAADLRDKVIQRICAAGLTLQSAASQTAEHDVRTKIGTTVTELDQTVRMLRDAIFGLEQRPDERGLRQRVMDLVTGLSPAPEISFAGPVDTALATAAQDELIARLSTALRPDGDQAAPTRVSIVVDGNDCQAVIETSPGERPVTWSVLASSDR
ncbi:MAG TPA: histidine kinase [Streptosporangiaceae bacterium]